MCILYELLQFEKVYLDIMNSRDFWSREFQVTQTFKY